VTIDLASYLRPGDTVVWGQACAEPRTLTRALVEQAARIGPIRCFVGIPAESALAGDLPPEIELVSYTGSGTNARLYGAGRLAVLPVHYSEMPDLLSTGALRADVVLVQVSAADEHGRHSLGLADDYFTEAIATARVVLAEVNDQVPFTYGALTVGAEDITASVAVSEPPAEMATPAFAETARGVARMVASLVEDGATLQFGVGGLPSAVLAALHGHRDLGIHSGIVNDAALDLIEAGVATGARKTLDPGVAIGGLLGGSRRLFAFAHRNPGLQLRPTRYTHSPRVLAESHQLAAINTALEVDLTGQVNAEAIGGRYVGAVGGAVDFLRGARLSKGGLPIVALPSVARGQSRIVRQLHGPVSTPRSEPVVVVTEHGAADLRGLTLEQRAERMIAIADPAYRRELDQDADRVVAAAARRC
jgi:acetyl-CoA hydrolase